MTVIYIMVDDNGVDTSLTLIMPVLKQTLLFQILFPPIVEVHCISIMATQMEVDEPVSSVMAAPGTIGSVTVALHPLVIMNISEHWTRVKAQEGKPTQGNFFF